MVKLEQLFSICGEDDEAYRTRECNNPESQLGGTACPGSDNMTSSVGE